MALAPACGASERSTEARPPEAPSSRCPESGEGSTFWFRGAGSHPRATPARDRPLLADAQLVLAREHGHASWSALVAAVEAPADEFVVAATSGRRGRAERMLAARPEIERDRWARLVLGSGWGRPAGGLLAELGLAAQEVIVLSALWGDLELVVDLVGPSYFAHLGGGPPGTLLHHASWVGNPDVVHRLLELGADPIARSGADFDTPLAWAVHGSRYPENAGRDYVTVAEQLVAAGGEIEPLFAEYAEGLLGEWLEERL